VSFTVFTKRPARLAGMAFPSPETHWDALYALGFRLVVRLHPGDYDPSPLAVREVLLEDLYGGMTPSDPGAEEARVWEAARIAAESLERGEGVFVHCLGGTGRTGTVVACTLRLLGRPVEEAIARVKTRLPRWPESPWQEEVVRSG